MITPARNKTIAAGNPQFLHYIGEGFRVYFTVIYQTNRVTNYTIFNTFNDFIDIALAYIFYQIELCIACDFDHMGFNFGIIEHPENQV